ncbi:MAG: hypothetical protein IIW48_08405 [Clostridia bacterium]|nr:hypothetical protein [Clostridia bacterium]
MRDDKLYKELGYQNFEEYCEQEVGMKRRNAYNYISIIEKTENVQSIAHFGMTKLSLLASLSEPEQEEIQDRVGLEDISVRKLKEEIARLKKEKSSTEAHLKIAQGQLRDENSEKIMYKNDLLNVKSKNRELTHELQEVREENKRLHETVSPDQKTQDALIRKLDRKLSEADQEHANDLERQRKRYQSQINELEERLKNTKTMIETVEVPATAEVFEAYCAVVKNAYAMLLNYVKNAGVTKDFTKEISKMIDSFDDELCEIM